MRSTTTPALLDVVQLTVPAEGMRAGARGTVVDVPAPGLLLVEVEPPTADRDDVWVVSVRSDDVRVVWSPA